MQLGVFSLWRATLGGRTMRACGNSFRALLSAMTTRLEAMRVNFWCLTIQRGIERLLPAFRKGQYTILLQPFSYEQVLMWGGTVSAPSLATESNNETNSIAQF